MNFGFEDVEETFSADLLSGLWALRMALAFWQRAQDFGGICTSRRVFAFFLKDDFKSLLDVTDRD